MIEKNLKKCNKFFNKLLIKIEDLENNLSKKETQYSK